MKTTNRRGEKGISLLFAMFTLLLVTALAMGMMFTSSTETSINSNFKASETAYFAARAGLEEVRDRMLPANPNTLGPQLPTTMPGPATGVLYVLANGVTAANLSNFLKQQPPGRR
jgi:Tfp pilus assembly protein PilX